MASPLDQPVAQFFLQLAHALGDGGYVLFEGGPASVYADGRLEVYGSENLERAFRVTWSGEGLEPEADRTGVHVVLIRNDIGYRPLLRHLDRQPGWVPVYYDHLHLAYMRVGPRTADLVERGYESPNAIVLEEIRIKERKLLLGNVEVMLGEGTDRRLVPRGT